MVEGKVISISTIAYVLGMNGKKLHRWYQDILSGFKEAKESKEIYKHDLKIMEEGVYKTVKVPILKPENMGKKLAIDEKTIDGVCYTILSNRESGKIITMADTLKTKHLYTILRNIPIAERLKVKSLSRDMAPNYDWLGRQAFLSAYHVIDKFHVIKDAIVFLQAVRIRHRQELLTKKRLHKEQKIKDTSVIYSNGDSDLQLIAKSNRLLFKMPSTWSEPQKARAALLFKHYPEIHTAYKAVVELRQWYRPTKGKTSYKKTRFVKAKQLREIITDFKSTGISEIQNLANMINNHFTPIISYFIANETNAKAEALNSQIQRFIMANYGLRNTDFFLFRLKGYFS